MRVGTRRLAWRTRGTARPSGGVLSLVLAAAVALVATGCSAGGSGATSADAPASPEASVVGEAVVAAAESCDDVGVDDGAVVTGTVLGACLTDTMRAANTFRFDVVTSANECSGDAQLEEFVLDETCTNGDAYLIRDDHIWQTAGEKAPRDAPIGYDGTDEDTLILSAAGALAISQSPLTTTQSLVAQTDWGVEGHEIVEDANGRSVDCLVFAAQGVVTVWGAEIADQRLYVDDSFALIESAGTASYGGESSTADQRYADWGTDLELPDAP